MSADRGAPPSPAAPTQAPSPEPAPATVDAALALARMLGVDRHDAQRLLSHRLGRDRAWLLAHGDTALPPDVAAALQADLVRRRDTVPLAYLTGRREFHGLDLAVTPAVLDPRPDTETLVDWALELLHGGDLAARATPVVVDLGTGSGAIALAVKHRCPRADVLATDASVDALAVAAANAARLGLAVSCRHGRWWDAVGDRRVDLALSNPPYVAAGDPHLAALRHEPISALVPAAGDALADLHAIVDAASRHLVAGGWLLLEHGHDQSAAVAARFAAAGWQAIGHRRDLGGHVRCTGARLGAGR